MRSRSRGIQRSQLNYYDARLHVDHLGEACPLSNQIRSQLGADLGIREDLASPAGVNSDQITSDLLTFVSSAVRTVCRKLCCPSE